MTSKKCDSLDDYFNDESIFRSVTNNDKQQRFNQSVLKFENDDFGLVTDIGIPITEPKNGTEQTRNEIYQIKPENTITISPWPDYRIYDKDMGNFTLRYDEPYSKPSLGKTSTFHPSTPSKPKIPESITAANDELRFQERSKALRASYFNSVDLRRSLSADNIVKNSKENEKLRPPELKHKSSSAEYLGFMNGKEKKHNKSESRLGKFGKTLLKKKKKAYSYVRTMKLPQRCHTGCSCNMVTSIAATNEDTFWLGFRDSRAIILCDMTGEVLLVANVEDFVDDIIRSSSGDLYISCPKAKCIKAIRHWEPDTVEVLVDLSHTPWHPRGLAICPGDDSIVACLASNATAHTTVSHTNNCLMKFETNTEDHLGSLVTNEKCFGYPLRVAMSSINNSIVFDFGFQCITIINADGLVIAKLTEINEVQISRRIAITFDKNDDVVVVQGKQPTLTVLKLDGSPLSVEDNSLPELTNCTVTAMAFSGSIRLLVGGSTGVLKVLKCH